MPALTNWAGNRQAAFGIIHPGSPRIIPDTAAALGLRDHDVRHSTETLAEAGNLGGVGILRVLERTFTTPPATRAHGIAVAYGPGFATAALSGHWHT